MQFKDTGIHLNCARWVNLKMLDKFQFCSIESSKLGNYLKIPLVPNKWADQHWSAAEAGLA